ncbi:MAG TPA: class I SAM-dependent methyltransferase [Candidatus Polarisedimenticolia bacterium]|nr:class I SAM-dependent methyltransferase [Candidatus Polarisedimenticolia bacterium]
MLSAVERRTRCVLCGRSADVSSPGAGGYRVCAGCDVAWRDIEDSPDAAADWEQHYYAESAIKELHERRRSGLAAIARRISEVCPWRGRLLDLGAGIGIFMKEAASLGWAVEGVEPSAIAARAARDLTHATIHEGLFEQVALPAGSYDAVTFFDALRTVPDPLAFLARARSVLRPGGILVVREVDRRAEVGQVWLKQALGKAQPAAGNSGFEYRQCFSPKSLRFAYREAGLVGTWVEPSPVFVEPDSGTSRVASLFKWSIGAVSGGAYRMTAGRLVLGPNLLAFGRAPGGSADRAEARPGRNPGDRR